MEWISVNDRLPPPTNKNYLTYGSIYDVTMSEYYDGDCFANSITGIWIDEQDGSELHGVTHWMPLPEPPKQ